jgi:hypothetical protein
MRISVRCRHTLVSGPTTANVGGCLRFERTTLSLYLYSTHSNFALSRQDGNWSSLASVMHHVPADPSSPVPASSSKSEKSYTQTALRGSSSVRAESHSLLDYHSIVLETGVASLANGSARVNAGKTADEESGSRTEAITAVKLEVENVLEGREDRVHCSSVRLFFSFFVFF